MYSRYVGFISKISPFLLVLYYNQVVYFLTSLSLFQIVINSSFSFDGSDFILCFTHLLSGQISCHSSSGVNGDASTSESHTFLANGYICRDCSFHSQKTDSYITRSSSSQAAVLSSNASSASSSPVTSVYSRDRSRKNKTGEKFSSPSELKAFLFV